MAKDAFYFQHDYNSATDVKILFLRQNLGMEGYGIYWFIVEQLANAGGTLPLKIIPVLAMQMQTNEVKVQGVINNFDLFIIQDECFFSNRLNSHLNIRKTLSQSGKKGAENRWLANRVAIGVANNDDNKGAIKQGNGDPNAKEKKGKERKEIKESKVNYRNNLFISNEENEKLVAEFGKTFVSDCYDYLSDYKEEKNYKTKSDYLTIKRWVVDAVTKKNINKVLSYPNDRPQKTQEMLDDLEKYKQQELLLSQNKKVS